MSKCHTIKEQQESGSESKQPTAQKQELLGHVPYFTDSIELKAYEGCFIAESPVKMAGNHTPPIRKGEDITGLSKNSRLRLIKRLATLHWYSYYNAVFSTLTYHEIYPQTGKELKIELDKFIKRMQRSFPKLQIVWRFELQKRGAPHFHFMFLIPKEEYPIDDRHVIQEVNEHWHALNPCGCSDCLTHGVKSEKIENFAKCLAYISKYVAKETAGQEKGYPGRRWGYCGEILFKAIETFKISGIQFIYLKLLLLSHYKDNLKRRTYMSDNLKNIYSLFVLCDAPALRVALVDVLKTPPKKIYEILKLANALPSDFEYPIGDIRINKQLPITLKK